MGSHENRSVSNISFADSELDLESANGSTSARSSFRSRPPLVLNKEKGYFYLGREDAADRMFQYEVKIIFGKNLHKALNPHFTPPPDPKYQVRLQYCTG